MRGFLNEKVRNIFHFLVNIDFNEIFLLFSSFSKFVFL